VFPYGLAALAHHVDGYNGRSSAIELSLDPERLQHAFKWDTCLATRRAHVSFSSMEEQEHGLLDRHHDRPHEPELDPLLPKPPNALLHSIDGAREP
jgi:hypothetical protein